MRGRLLRFEAGFAVINDTYNSNPVALGTMIKLLAQTPGYRRRILAAGEMLELGPQSAQLHREAGRQAAAQKLNWVVGVQGQASKLVAGAVEAGVAAANARFFPTSSDAAAFLSELVQPGDLLLVKGSRGVKMERIVEALRDHFALTGAAAEASPAGQGHD
jgi:UDP-N-acetylmuramoyl-tripeptide--D-alanyl-D-alanine ligase